MFYILTRDDQLFGITVQNPYGCHTDDISIHEADGAIPDMNLHVWDPETETLVLSTRTCTKLEFSMRFTLEERTAIRNSSDPIVQDIMRLMDAAEFINLDYVATVQGLGYIASVGLLTPERVAAILA